MVERPPFAAFEHAAAVVERQPVLCVLLGNVKLEQHFYDTVVSLSLSVDFLQKLQRVHCLYHGNVRRDVLHLVCLQMSDEVPLYVLRQALCLNGKFLFAALSEHPLTCVVCLHDAL